MPDHYTCKMRTFAPLNLYDLMVEQFLCFDTESAQGRFKGEFREELIEIAIMNAGCREVFYHRFKPALLTKWDTSIHHITPAMVAGEPRFATLRPQVQAIFDNAEYIIGFSLIDDFKALSKAGITDADKHRIVELRHLYWYCIGRHNDVPFYSGPGLSHCAEELGVHIESSAVHTANGDTRVTLDLFFALMRRFSAGEGLGEELPPVDSTQFVALVDHALERIADAKYDYDRRMAAGYIHIVKTDDSVYRFVPSASEVREQNDTILCIPVNARRRAMFELEKQYSRRRISGTKNYRLTPNDITAISSYTNEFDNQEQMYQKLLNLQRLGGTSL